MQKADGHRLTSLALDLGNRVTNVLSVKHRQHVSFSIDPFADFKS